MKLLFKVSKFWDIFKKKFKKFALITLLAKGSHN